MKIRKEKENIRPLSSETVKFTEMGNVLEVLYMSSKNTKCSIKKISSEQYIDCSTGEIRNFKHIENRADDFKSVSRSLKLGRDILNTNIIDVSKCRWLTLTYADNMTNSKKLLKDFENFNKRCREKYGYYEYITCAEPQGRGAWHMHVVLIFENSAPYMPNSDVAKLWRKGFVTIKKLDDVDNVGAYLTAYLADMELTEFEQAKPSSFWCGDVEEKEVEQNGQKVSKKFLKGARMLMYPPGMHIFRYSKGIKKPCVTFMDNEQAEKKVSSAKLTFEKTLVLSDGDKFESVLNYRYYNTKR